MSFFIIIINIVLILVALSVYPICSLNIVLLY